MNLLKRLFSIGSKKNKKKRAKIVHNVPLPDHDLQVNDDQEHEAAIGRLLRTSSARYAETPELCYATLPPLPHPINKVIQTPATSTISLASTSLSQRGTYNVTVHKRRRHASTEFPHANRDLDDQQMPPNQARVSLLPVEDSRVLRLRSDPSVASLLDLYDEHGKLSSNAFSNSPPNSPVKEGRVQCRRNGSTLRQLLGAPSLSSRHENDSGSEGGDISWAERFLGEIESASSDSLRTSNTPRGECEHNISFNIDGDVSGNAPENPAISSMEVELSMTTDTSQDLEASNKNHPYINSNPSTPQRASQVFRFLTRGKQSEPAEEFERSLPEPPSAFSSPSDENVSCDKIESHFSENRSDFTFAASQISAMPTLLSDDTSRMPRARLSLAHPPVSQDRPASQELRSTFSDDSHDPHEPANLVRGHTSDAEIFSGDVSTFSKQNDVKVIMNGPTKVIVTAPTPSTNHVTSSRIPGGPRAFPRRSSGSVKRRRSALVELSNSTTSTMDPFTAVPSRRRTQTHHRSNSQNSMASISRKNWDGSADYISKPIKLVSTAPQQKENQLSLSVRQEIPATPLRSNTTCGSRSLFRSVVHQGMFQPPAGTMPSPASSSEMSPVGRQMMMDVRQQRLKAREADRERSGKRFGNERNGLRI